MHLAVPSAAAQAETTLINFNVTEGGLEEALVALVVSRERADLETAKSQLIVQSAEFVVRLNELENGLLDKLSSAEGDLTENTALIESLEESKALADEVRLHALPTGWWLLAVVGWPPHGGNHRHAPNG